MAIYNDRQIKLRIRLLWLMILVFIAICWVAVLISR